MMLRCCALQGWLGIKDTVLHSGEGAIQCVRWSSSLIAWANAVSTKVHLQCLCGTCGYC
jgi:hypothetical protein